LRKVATELLSERFELSAEVQNTDSGLDRQFKKTLETANIKQKALEKELQHQKSLDDAAARDFAEAVKSFTEWINQRKRHLSATSPDGLETQLQEINDAIADDSSVTEKLEDIAQKDEQVKARQVTNNPYTNVTQQDCTVQYSQFKILLQKKKELLEVAIEDQKKAGLSEEQLQEIKETFDHFNKDKEDAIPKRAVRSCLQSLGEEATPQQVDKIFEEFDADKDGKLQYDEFQLFMFRQLGDSNTKDEIIQGFKYLSLDNDTILASQLEAVVNETTFKDKHVEYLKREMKKKGSGLDFPKWTQEVFDR